MKKGVKSIKGEPKGFVWFSLRISFYLMILLFLISFLITSAAINLLFLILLIFIIIVSIIHLVKYNQKAFAITILVISALLLLFYIVGLANPATGESTISKKDAIQFLEDQGYTVNNLEFSKERSTLSMDKKGAVDLQVTTGFGVLVRSSPSSQEYNLDILTETQTCSYTANFTTAEMFRKDSFEALKLVKSVCI
ncbi:MAG: hypothetical protein Q8O84_04420 [Nanoarchaeota archaeon]|nr:hypothetical protein [Nanoarchaeota archaeon]